MGLARLLLLTIVVEDRKTFFTTVFAQRYIRRGRGKGVCALLQLNAFIRSKNVCVQRSYQTQPPALTLIHVITRSRTGLECLVN